MLWNNIELIITEDQLSFYTTYWKDRLNLNQWDIEVRISDSYELGTAHGRNRYDWQAMESRIDLIHPDHFQDWKPYDMEFILVHELLHLIIDVQYPVVKGRRETFSEQAINQIAKTLLQFEREYPKDTGSEKKKKRKKGK